MCKTSIKTLSTVDFFEKLFLSKELKKKKNKRQMQIVAKICQNRIVRKDRFFRKCYVTQIEKC